MATTSRLFTIIAIGLLAVLSVAVVLTAVTVTRNNVLSRSTRSEEEKERKECPLTASKLKEALASICERRPDLLLNVTYEKVELHCGVLTTEQKTEEMPTVKLKNAVKNAHYTLVMVDPNATGASMKDLTFYLHWVITFSVDEQHGIETISTPKRYAGPTPPNRSGVHSYQMIVFESPGDVHLSDKKERNKFSLEEFVKKNNLCAIVGLFEFKVDGGKK